MTRTLGDTGLRVSAVGLGLAALGRAGYMTLGRDEDLGPERSPAALEARAAALLSRAWEAGVRYFDAARSYGDAEAFLGRWLTPARAATVGSKWGYTYVAEGRVHAPVHEVKDHARAVLDRQWPESRAHLGSRLSVYAIHSATLETGVLADRAVLERLAALRAEAGIHVGLSVTGAAQADVVRAAMAVEVAGARLFDVVQATWNPLEPSVGPALAEAAAAGLGVVIKEGVANGRLTARGLETLAPGVAAVVRARADAHGVGVDTWALAAAVARPFVHVVLSGAVTAAQLDSNLAAVDVAWSGEDEAALAACAEAPADYWSTRARLPWQ